MKIILFTFMSFLTTFTLDAAEWAAVISGTGPAIGRVIIKDSHGVVISEGTGFNAVYKNKRVFVTNAHVIRDAWYDKSMTVNVSFDFDVNTSESERLYDGSITRIDTSMDLGLISLNRKRSPAIPLGPEEKAGLMTALVVAGYPLGKSFKATPGMIQAFQNIESIGEMIDMSATLAPGNSGGPVLNDKGEVIGIATAIIKGYNFNLAIPVGNLIRFIDYKNNQVELNITVTPSGSRVFINGDYKGDTPVLLKLYNNEYKVRIENDNYTPLEKTIGPWKSLTGNSLTGSLSPVVNHNPVIRILTNPSGAEIYVGNSKIGISPVSIEMSPGRILRIRASKGTFKKGSMNYRVTDEAEQTVRIDLN